MISPGQSFRKGPCHLPAWALSLACASLCSGQGSPRLIKGASEPLAGTLPAVEHLASLNGAVYFAGRDAGHGQELWRSDGTPQGTKLLKDLNPGKGSSFPVHLVTAGDKLFFFASDLEGGFRLWKSDGTAEGTVPVAGIDDGQRPSQALKLIAAGEKVFILNPKVSPEEPTLWCSDGTPEGTRMLPLPEGTAQYFYWGSPMVVGDAVYFFAGQDLWGTDGTPEGTQVALPHGRDGFHAWDAVQAGGRIYLPGEGLRVFDPASGELQIPEFWNENMEELAVYSLKRSGRYLLFEGYRSDESSEFWVSDGTSKGTFLSHASDMPQSPSWSEGIEIRGRHLMGAYTPGKGYELWVSNGTRKGTKMLCNLAPGPDSSHPLNFTKLGNRGFFTAWTPRGGDELWMSSATAAGTDLLLDIRRGKESSYPQQLTVAANLIFWTADDGKHGRQLWCSNGTRRGTRKLTDLDTAALSSSPWASNGGEDGYTAGLAGRYFFPITDDEGYSRLWASDGSAAGTKPLASGLSGKRGSNPGQLMVAGERVYYYTWDHNDYGRLLWASGGESANTSVVLDLSDEDDAARREIGVVAAFGQSALLTRWTGLDRDGLWLHRQAGPQAVPVAPGDAPPFGPGQIAFLTGYDPANGYEPWITDGTLEGTRLLKDVRIPSPYDPTPDVPNPSSSKPEWLGQAGGKTYFSAMASFVGRELWVTDGTPGGTQLVKDIASNNRSSRFSKVHAWGDKLVFFAGYDTGYYQEAALWITDGTSQGTRSLVSVAGDSWYLPRANNGAMFAELNGKIYFTAKMEDGGHELWSTDGTLAGTGQVKDIFPGQPGSEPEWLTSTGNAIYFTANDGKHGRELWRTDGTEAGTMLVSDPTMDASSSFPRGLAYTGGKLFFRAITEATGMGAWVIDEP